MRALLLQAFYSIRSERQLVERIENDLLFRWFVELDIEDPVWDATTFTKNRDRLLSGDVTRRFCCCGTGAESRSSACCQASILGGWDAVGSVGKAGPGKEARLVFMGHALMENRNGFVIGAMATRASG